MGLDERMTVTQVARNATKTLDGISAYLIVGLACLAFAYVATSRTLFPGAVSDLYGNKIIELSIFSVLTTPILYLGLAYFSACGRTSEIINAFILLSVNAYLVYRFFI